MNKQMLAAGLLLTCLTPGPSITLADQVTSLRGITEIDKNSSAPTIKRYNKDGEPFSRDYIQQPPLIPHSIDRYRINLRSNKCMSCHSWKNYRHSGATKVFSKLSANDKGIQVSITDNGHGLQNINGNPVPPSIKRRANLLRGQVSIEHPDRGGLRVILKLNNRAFRIFK